MDQKDNIQDQNVLPDTTVEPEEMDAGSQALTDAFQKAFVILKFVMVIIIIVFLAKGVFKVRPGERALVIRLGEIRDKEPLKEGLHWALPDPISEVIIIPVTETQVLPINLFWYFQTEKEKLSGEQGTGGETLIPGRDGYCLVRNEALNGQAAADYNIVHAKWQLTYSINRPELFYRNVYYRGHKPGESLFDAARETIEPLLRSIAADAIVETMLRYSIDKAIVSDEKIPNDVKIALQDKLLKIKCGIKVDSVRVDGKITWPRQVNNAFEKSNQARQVSGKYVEEATGYADKILREAGGENAEKILAVLKDPKVSDEEKEKQLLMLSGVSQKRISQARADRTKIVKSAEANAVYFKAMLPEFRQRPKLVVQKLHQDAIAEVLNNADEKTFLEPSANGKGREVRIMVNRDPSIKPKKKNKKGDQGEDTKK